MKSLMYALIGLLCFLFGTLVYAAGSGAGFGLVAGNVLTNLPNVARLITAASYTSGMAFVVGAIVKFKAHKDNPTQIPIGTPIALLFIGGGLIFVPGVFKAAGFTLMGSSGVVAGISGFVSFGVAGPSKS